MGIIFWIVLFVTMGALIEKIKKSWKKGNIFNSIIWIIVAIIIFSVFAFVRQYTIENNRYNISEQKIESQFELNL